MIDALKLAKARAMASAMHGGNGKPYAIVVDGKVVNVTLWDADEHPRWKPTVGEAIACDATVAIGHTCDGLTFTAPPVAVHASGRRRPSLRQEIEAVKKRLDALERGTA